MRFDRVAVTGGSGRLGRFVVDELSRHTRVTVLDIAPGPSSTSPSSTSLARQRHIVVDILDLDGVYRALEGHDAVVHLAAIDAAVETTPKRYFETNVEGSFNILQAAHDRGISKLVMASSVAAFGFGGDNPDHPPRYLPIDEAHPLNPNGAYGLSKQVGEVVARGFAIRGVTQIACLRPTLIIRHEVVGEVDNLARLEAGDPSGIANFDLSGIAEPFGEALSAMRSYVMPEDVARCFRRALEVDFGAFDIFNVAARDTIGPIDSLAALESELGYLPEVRDPERYAADPTASLIDSRHARDILGWEAPRTWPEIVSKQ
ncbi:MAG: NAD(P)-dependent oxidoreductase [Proteobacteria bacterium]|nr:NAD(P)-dependent oxidoreductase [Pseudomonadota bacterium]